MQTESKWTRRRLLKTGGLGIGAGVAGSFGVIARAARPEQMTKVQNAYVYVASAGTASEKHGVQVYRVRSGHWEPLQFVSSRSPSSLTLSPDGRMLFVTNSTGLYKGLPTSSVEAWAIDTQTGRLKLLNRQGLALAAVFASHADVSPDGSTLAVSAACGSVCVLLPVREDGSLGAITAVRKELRLRPVAEATSAPSSSLPCFAPDGNLLFADCPGHVLSVLSFAAGPLELVDRVELPRACTSASMQRRAATVDVHLHDQERQRMGMLSYAGELTPLRRTGERLPDLHDTALRELLEAAPSFAPTGSPSRLEANCIDTTERQGRCFLRSSHSAEIDTRAPTAMAWVRA